MKITVSKEAQNWFVSELELTDHVNIRFFGKYGGSTNVHTGFTTGMELAEPTPAVLATHESEQISFFVAETDEWFFAGYDLLVDYDPQANEPTYFYQEQDI